MHTLAFRPQVCGSIWHRPTSRLACQAYYNRPITHGSSRRFLDKVTKDANASWDSRRDSARFLSALLEFDDPVDLLYRLNNPKEHGLARLRVALTQDGSARAMATYVIPFLKKLGGDELSGGTCRAPLLALLDAIYRVPGLLGCLRGAVASGQVADAAPVGWFLLTLAAELSEVRSNPEVHQLAADLAACGGDAAKVAARLQVVLAGAAEGVGDAQRSGGGAALEDLLAGPGGRHDNDHGDYRSVNVMVTSEEALCARPPYLPRSVADGESCRDLCNPEAATLDRQFRLLREDYVQPLREILESLGFAGTCTPATGGPQPPGAPRKPDPVIQQRNVFPVMAVAGAALKPRGCVMVAVSLPPSHRVTRMKDEKEREAFWREFGKGTLPVDALVCLAWRPRQKRPPQPLLFGAVARREPKEMACEFPLVGIAFERGQPGVERLLQELGRGRRPAGEGLVLMQVSSNFFSVRPVLSRLQAMPGVPLAEELVHGQHPGSLEYLPQETAEKELSRLADAGVVLDPSQQEALQRCLSQRVALVQGPPGAGKTFVGALVVDAIVRHSSETILVVCYTNHALDQFLEALLDKGIKDIVRIGRRSKNPALAEYNLRELTASGPNRQVLSQTAFRRFMTLNDLRKELDQKVSKLQQLLSLTAGVALEQPPKAGLWDELKLLLRDEYDDEWAQLTRACAPRQDREAWVAWLSGRPAAPDAYSGSPSGGNQKSAKRAEAYSKAVAQLYSNVARVSSAARYAEPTAINPGGGDGSSGSGATQEATTKRTRQMAAVAAASDVWQLPHAARLQLASRWVLELRKRWSEELASCLSRASEVQSELRSLHEGSSRAVLRAARVVGCTTTGAALHRELLRAADVEPGVVLVEEAGELLEAHVLTSTSARTKHLIMIGDHRQLRPKVECYQLSVQSGCGYDLNVSLFERLVLAGSFPHTTLAVQHRMHPDISALVRPTYPALQDAEGVRSHPPVRGLARGRRVVFVDHREPELGEREGGGWLASAAQVSKVNPFEVLMVRETVRYLLRQGYLPGQLVVLTPYLGQLLELQSEMSRDMQVLLDELDLRDLRAAATAEALSGVAEAAGGGSGDGGVRVATIDNYQGEEADVVVASLVRSNDDGGIGFLREPERINVLLSRARHGMILIGNTHTLRHAKNPEGRRHWGRVLDALEASGAVQPGLPAVCQRHGTESLLDSPAAFAELAPDGGCRRPCHEVLKCGHRCMLRCHSHDPQHERILCREEVLDCCSQGHIISRRCSQDKSSAVCATCTELRRIEEAARAEVNRLEEEAALRRQKAELDHVRLQARVSQLRRQQEALEAQRAARQEAVRLELQGQQLSRELELQEKYGRVELQQWEREQRQQAQREMDAMEESVKLETQLRTEEEAEARQREEEEVRRRALAAADEELRALEAARETELQRIANDQRRLAAQADEQRDAAETRADDRLQRYRSLSSWKEAVAQAVREGGTGTQGGGLAALRRQLVQAAGGGGDPQAASDTGATLDTLFGEPGIGKCIVEYALAAAMEAGVAEASSPQPLSGPLQRAMSRIQVGSWLDAFKILEPLAKPPAAGPNAKDDAAATAGVAAAAGVGPGPDASKERSIAASLLKICRTRLGLFAAGDSTASGMRLLTPGKPHGGNKSGLVVHAPSERKHAVDHLAAALAADVSQPQQRQQREAGVMATASAASRAAWKAAGGALACLLHPSASQLPATLTDEAWRLVQEAAALPPGPLIPGAANRGPAGGGSAPQPAAQQQQQRPPAYWEAAAGRYPSLAQLLKLTGLAPVKQAMCELAAAVELDKERGRAALGSKQYNVRFYGNPGTGKTTVARLYGGLLKELGVLPEAQSVETSGSELLTGGVSKLKEQLAKLEKGGVLFLDEAYQLNPKTNPMGAQVLDYLLPEMENRRGRLVVVLAGYRKQMDELMAHNEGLPSRFVQEFTFPDYSDDELLALFRDLIAADQEAARFRVADERHLRIAARRLGRLRGTSGFGNARAVRNAFEAAQRRQSARVLAARRSGLDPDPLLLMREDLLGPKHLDVSSCAALQELGSLRGLAAVKRGVEELLGLIRTNAELEEAERPVQEVNLNRVFLGNPGTGKTTVARLYGRLLSDLGLLSKGEVVVKVPADFVGAVLGESEKRTEAILEAARGCVLVIDEAYGLHAGEGGTRDPFREAVVDTLVARVQGVPGEDRCVLLLGYQEPMEALMRAANPGLARRFNLQQAWTFGDYGAEDLLHITKEAAAKRGWRLGEDALLAAVEALETERRKPNFGNAGSVNNLLSTAALRMEGRLRGLPPAARAEQVPQPEDFLPPREGGDPAGIFDDLIGCESVLSQLRQWQATIRACQALGRDPLQSVELNFRFVGAPGTGKTTVARRLGRLFESLGLLASSQVVACSASDFVTGFANQSGGKTREVFQKAVGGVLFVDEAYRLNPKVGGPFMQEVLDEMVQLLTEPAFMGKMVVVLAGYEQQIEQLMSVNPGLKSRFSQRLHFPDFTPADAAALLRLTLRREYGLELAGEAEAALGGMAEQLVAAPNWSNGRDVATWAKRAFAAFSTRNFSPAPPGPAPTAAATTSSGSIEAPHTADQDMGAGPDTGPGSPLVEAVVTLSDLRTSLDSLLADKEPPYKAAAHREAGATADQVNSNGASGAMPSSWPLALAQQPALAFAFGMPLPPAALVAPPATATAAPPTAASAVPLPEAAAAQETFAATAPPAAATSTPDFGGLPPAFLRAVQDGLEALGYDLTSLDAVQRLAGDPALVSQLLPYLSAVPAVGTDANVLREMVRQWQAMIQQRAEEERELARKKQRPVWRCAACGRYGCPVAPYIERYKEV